MEILSYKPIYSRLVASFFREIFKESGWQERPSDYMDEPDRLFHLPDGGILLVVKKDDNIIGTAGLIKFSDTECLMKRFYLKSIYRGTGIAKTLLEKLTSEAKSVGVKKIILDVSKNNLRAIRFYEKNGFFPTQVKPQENWPESKLPESHYYLVKNI